ncbi:unnamed protein product [Dracunculus medinensis]|uniref:Uncharacterized protein n=1 Tax=Dracunculus medinensis TaxID=318479 RepID=A0A0N4UN24_DRAME|nr:unnamed protein product [Dracunculus medinensis]
MHHHILYHDPITLPDMGILLHFRTMKKVVTAFLQIELHHFSLLYNQFPFLLSATVNYHLESSASETALEGAMNIREFLSNDIGFNGIIPDQDRTNLSARKILGIM